MEKELINIHEIDYFTNSLGLLMIKPHAFETALDIPIRNLFEENKKNVLALLNIESSVDKKMIDKLSLCKTLIRDISVYPNRKIFDIICDKEKLPLNYNYQLLSDAFSGKVLFLIFFYNGSFCELNNILLKIRGTKPPILDNEFLTEIPHGIRGHFMCPIERFTQDQLNNPNDEELLLMINNVVHTPDTLDETLLLLEYLLSIHDIQEINTRFNI